jgi:hypothetical protein
MDKLMTVASVAVMGGTPLLLIRLTSLPQWACFLIGVPGGLAVFWLVLFTALRVLARKKWKPEHGPRQQAD